MKRKKYIIILAIIIFILLILFLSKIYLKSLKHLKYYNSSTISFKYNNFWHITDNEKNFLQFKHENGSTLDISLKFLNNEQSTISVNKLANLILNSMDNNYKVIYKKNDKLTSKSYDGYNFILENNEENLLISIIKNNNKLVVVEYSSKIDDFDFLLDSVLTTIWNLEFKEI